MKGGDQKYYQLMLKKINKFTLIQEHRLYKEEQILMMSPDLFIVRNGLNWVIRVNKLIRHYEYCLINAIEFAQEIKIPIEETDNRDSYSFHLENAVYRQLVLWDMYAKLLNETYALGLKRDELSIWDVIRSMRSSREPYQRRLAKELKKYCNGAFHQYVRNYLRNTFAHNGDPHGKLIFHYYGDNGMLQPDDGFILPDHPIKELRYLIIDFIKLHRFLNKINQQIKKIMLEKTILIEYHFETLCGREITDGRHIPITILQELHEIWEISDTDEACEECRLLANNHSLKYCKPVKFVYHRINEPEGTISITMKS
ncbi:MULTISPECIES: Cthe_2314 family HEPN domain-containing protein [unclassified Paenibacillus]|uniref:Cthe_2314 family HEPN domain-containing protein n=1 Tax=unclassified Paenibacillus TaxID=185978 RepID=UPI0008D36352|nr:MULTISPECIES: Cthe_2314 family HEPN domain-containing protein [unclassified Paenibacillus]QLG41263.1 hypothetical protein HW560_26265 [Paenibacillus sp. E222]SEN32514.1 hypothetical protein SAMN05518670_1582 [Paenibacillus sp. OK076]